MNDATIFLNDALKKQMSRSHFEIIGLISIPSRSNRGSRMQILQDLLEDDTRAEGTEVIEYLIQLKPNQLKNSSISKPKTQENSLPPKLGVKKQTSENIYLPNGKLNLPYLSKNAEILFEAREYTLARNIYKAILRSGEQTSGALYCIGHCYEEEGKQEEARSYYEESIAYRPNLETYQRLATLLIKQNKDQNAAEVMERAIHLKDLTLATRFELHKTCGNCWTRVKKPEDAERNFKKALEINPTADDIRSNLGVLYLQIGKTAEAKRNFQDAIASNPRNHLALAGMGSCYLAEEDKQTAHDYFTQSLEIEINHPTAIFYLVKCAYELKSYATAAKLLKTYVQTVPAHANLLYSLAGLEYHLGRMSEAKATVLKVLEIQPDHTGAKELSHLIERYTGP